MVTTAVVCLLMLVSVTQCSCSGAAKQRSVTFKPTRRWIRPAVVNSHTKLKHAGNDVLRLRRVIHRHKTSSLYWLLISAPRLGVYYFLSLPLSVCMYVCLSQTLLLLLCFGIEPFLGHQFSMTKTTKRCSSIFDLGLLTPKIYSPLQNLHKIAYKSDALLNHDCQRFSFWHSARFCTWTLLHDSAGSGRR